MSTETEPPFLVILPPFSPLLFALCLSGRASLWSSCVVLPLLALTWMSAVLAITDRRSTLFQVSHKCSECSYTSRTHLRRGMDEQLRSGVYGGTSSCAVKEGSGVSTWFRPFSKFHSSKNFIQKVQTFSVPLDILLEKYST